MLRRFSLFFAASAALLCGITPRLDAADPPVAMTLGSTNVTASAATLHGTVNPNGSATTAFFRWGTTTNYGSATAFQPLAAGTNTITVQAALSNLAANTTYHFRLLAFNSDAVSLGEDIVFQTQTSLPAVITTGSSNLTTTSVAISGKVNPNGLATSIFFQWGATTNYGATTATQMLAGGSVSVPVQAILAPLASNTAYHYRLVATNADGIAFGKDVILTTGEGLALNEGENWTYEFHDLPHTYHNACFSCGSPTSFARGGITVLPESFLPGAAIRFEMFENLPGEAAIASTDVLAPSSGTNVLIRSWSDLQGSVRFTMLSGSAVITSVGFFVEAQGFRVVDQYANTIMPSRLPQPPLLLSQSVNNISFQSATVLTEVNPRNMSANIYFQWGATTNYGFASPPVSTNRDYAVPVVASLSGLNPGANYHLRTVASNAVGVVFGPDIAFSTLIPSSLTTQPASSLRSTSAVLNASVTANGFATTVFFEWGSTTNYGQVTPAQNIGSPTTITNVSALVTGLSKELLYHYRVVAVSAGVTNRGEDVAFNTTPVPAHVVITNIAAQDVRFALETGGSVVFACDGVVALSNQIEVANNLWIDGTGHSVTFSGSNTSRLFSVLSGVSLALTNVALANGRSTNGGAIYNDGGNVFAENCRFSNNAVVGLPGANGTNGLAGTNGSSLELATPGTAGGAGSAGQNALGGAIFNTGTLGLYQCRFDDNTAVGGAGGKGGNGGNGGRVLSGITVVNAKNGGDGGLGGHGGSAIGACVANSGTVAVDRCQFSNSSAIGGFAGSGGTGGMGFISNVGMGGRGGSGGLSRAGVIHNEGNGFVFNSTFAGNWALGGNGGDGGITPVGGARGVGGNAGSAVGGSIGNASNLVLINCTLVTNTVTGGRGGAGLCSSTGGNGGDALGGGLANEGNLRATNVTMNGNVALGGVIITNTFGPVSGCFLTPPPNGTNGNSFGGSIANSGIFVLANSILAFGSNNNCYGAITDGGHNISSDATPAWISGTSSNNVDPLLLPLANNGGPTLTMALRVGSPALNAADPATSPATDQRGYPRPVGPAPDIGAYEGLGAPALEIIRESNSTNMIRWFAEPARVYRLEQTGNLKDWTPLATNMVGADGFLNFPVSATPSPRFFRVVAP